MTRLRTMFALTALLSTLALAVPSAAAAADPPGDRRNFVVALMRNVGTESFVRLAQYSLRADGTVRSETLANHATASRVSLASHPRATDGFGWGSTFGFTGGVPMQTIHNLHGRYDGPYTENGYGRQSTGTTTLVIHANDANVPDRTCNATCLNETTYKGTAVSNKVYIASSGTDRKVFYNHQLAKVDGTACIGGNTSGYAGHMKPSLSIVDDAGRFRGLLSVQAVTYNYTDEGNILGIYDQNDVV